jgi:hypothetical protein
MRRVFHIAVAVLLTYLVADRTMLHMQAQDTNSVTCSQGAEEVRLDALNRGFGEAGASSQKEAFMSGCLVMGTKPSGEMLARN